MIVVLTCAVLSIVITRKNQEKIKEITEYSTPCTVLRDGNWVNVDSTELVPGEKLKITEVRQPCSQLGSHRLFMRCLLRLTC